MLKRLANPEESVWISRLIFQIFHLTGAAFPDPKDEHRFKGLQWSLVNSLRECRDAQLELNQFLENHCRDVAAGQNVIITNGHIDISEDIEPKLNRLFKDFFSKARTCLYKLYGQKDNPESVTFLLLGYSLSFVQVNKEATFEKLAAEFLANVPGDVAKELVEVIRKDRESWMSVLIGTRDRIIHDVDCPDLKMAYAIIDGKVRVDVPMLGKYELRQCLELYWWNLFQSIEQVIVYCISIRMGQQFVPVQIAPESVDPQLPFHWALAFRHRSGS